MMQKWFVSYKGHVVSFSMKLMFHLVLCSDGDGDGCIFGIVFSWHCDFTIKCVFISNSFAFSNFSLQTISILGQCSSHFLHILVRGRSFAWRWINYYWMIPIIELSLLMIRVRMDIKFQSAAEFTEKLNSTPRKELPKNHVKINTITKQTNRQKYVYKQLHLL